MILCMLHLPQMPHLKPNVTSLMLPPTVPLTVRKSSLQNKIRHPLWKLTKIWEQFMFMQWGKVTHIPVYVEMTVCWFLSILLLMFFFLHKTAEKDHNNHRLECSLAKPHYWKRDEMATLSQTFPCPWERKQWFKERKRSWKHEKGEENKRNGCDLGDIAPGDERKEGGKCQIPEWFGFEWALQIQSPAKDRDTFHQNSKAMSRGCCTPWALKSSCE